LNEIGRLAHLVSSVTEISILVLGKQGERVSVGEMRCRLLEQADSRGLRAP
jgi:hypothetical protein